MRFQVCLMISTSFIVIFACLPTPSQAQNAKPLDDASTTALQQTQAMLGDQKQIQEYTKTHPEAAKANSQVQSLTGGNSADTAGMYKLASDIFGNMTKDSGGDEAGMQKTLANAMKNPQAFAEKLSPDQQAQLKSLSTNIESRQPTSNPH